MQRAPRVDVAVRLHHLDCAARDVAPAEPDHSAYPAGHSGRIEHFTRREGVEVAGQDVKGEGALLSYQLLLYSIQQAAQLPRSLSLTPLREPRAQVQDEKAWEAVAKLYLEHCVARSGWMTPLVRSEERRVGKEGRLRWPPGR